MKRLLRAVMLLLVRILGAPAANRARKRSGRQVRILLVRPDHLGDLVLTTPVLAAVREHAPDAEITMMVGPWSKIIVERHPALDHVIDCPFPGFQRAPQHPLAPYALLWRTARQLRRGNYDLAINLRHDFWWGAALLYLASIPHRAGYALEPGRPFLTHALPFPEREHAAVSNLRLVSAGLAASGYSVLDEPYTPERYPLFFEPTPEEEQEAARLLQAGGIEASDQVIVIHPGSGAAVKLWRSDAWANCAQALKQPVGVFRIVLTGSPSERPLLEEIANLLDQPPLLVTNATVGQLAAILKRAHLVLGVDNGPLHLAVAQKTPSLAIFGPTDVRIFGPWGSPAVHKVIASTQRCPTCPAIPCGRLDFSAEELEEHPCVRLVTELEVEDVALSLLTIAGVAQKETGRL